MVRMLWGGPLMVLTLLMLHSNETWGAERLSADPVERDQQRDITGIGFGVGAAAVFDLSGDKRVRSAEINNNIARVNEEEPVPQLLLETHIFFQPFTIKGSDGKPITYAKKVVRANASGGTETVNVTLDERHPIGIGPFLALTLDSTRGEIGGFGVGLMMGVKRVTAVDKNSSINIGLGVMFDRAKILGDGVRANQAPPAGETTVRTKKENRTSLFLMVSIGF